MQVAEVDGFRVLPSEGQILRHERLRQQRQGVLRAIERILVALVRIPCAFAAVNIPWDVVVVPEYAGRKSGYRLGSIPLRRRR